MNAAKIDERPKAPGPKAMEQQPMPEREPEAGPEPEPDPEPENDTRNPLWVVAMGMAVLFGVFAFVVAMT
jgi:hypothetical protein